MPKQEKKTTYYQVRIHPQVHRLLKILGAHCEQEVCQMTNEILWEMLESRFSDDDELKSFVLTKEKTFHLP